MFVCKILGRREKGRKKNLHSKGSVFTRNTHKKTLNNHFTNRLKKLKLNLVEALLLKLKTR